MKLGWFDSSLFDLLHNFTWLTPYLIYYLVDWIAGYFIVAMSDYSVYTMADEFFD